MQVDTYHLKFLKYQNFDIFLNNLEILKSLENFEILKILEF